MKSLSLAGIQIQRCIIPALREFTAWSKMTNVQKNFKMLYHFIGTIMEVLFSGRSEVVCFILKVKRLAMEEIIFEIGVDIWGVDCVN